MNIHDNAWAALQAATASVLSMVDNPSPGLVAQKALEASAPLIAAQALRDAADAEYMRDGATGVVERMLARANDLGPL